MRMPFDSERDTERVDSIIEVAKAIIGIGCKIAFGPVGALADPFANVLARRTKKRLEQRAANRMLEECADIVAKQILASFDEEYRDLADNEYLASVIAVKETLEKAFTNTKDIIKLDLNAAKLRQHVQPAANEVLKHAALSDSATEFYRRALADSCAYLVQFVMTLPANTPNVLQELLQRQSQILERLKYLLERIPRSRNIDDFEADYRQALMTKLDRMELFGVNIGEASSNYPLSVAYVSLQVLRKQQQRNPNLLQPPAKVKLSTGSRVEEVLATLDRALVIGDAGSGKTTLLRYLAVSSAVARFDGPLEEWNDYVPFYVPLRRYVDNDLPRPEQFPIHVAATIIGEMPNGWVHEKLREGKALILIDGVDEMPDGALREKARTWLGDLVDTYPKAHYIVTSRPGVISDTWPRKSFAVLELQPMSTRDIHVFIRNWHAALLKELGQAENRDELRADERAILSSIDTDRNIRRLAVNPLLCALLCALNRERKRRLPKEKMEIYAAALDMLLARRDRERGMEEPLIDPSSQRIVLRVLAFWLFRQGLATAPTDRIEAQVRSTLPLLSIDESMSPAIVKYLITRSGMLREPSVGRIDFIHRTFQEYLAAEAAVHSDDLELLVKHAEDDQWREVIIMAAGHAQQRQREALLRGLLSASRDKQNNQLRISLLTVACLQTAHELDTELRHEIETMAASFIPPSSMEAAESLAPTGSLALEVLAKHLPRNEAEASASVRLAAMIGANEGIDIIGEIASAHSGIGQEVIRALVSFDPVEYAKQVFPRANLGPSLEIVGPDLLPHIGFLSSIEELKLDPLELLDLASLGNRPPQLGRLTIKRRVRHTIEGLERWNGLSHLAIIGMHGCPDLSPVSHITTLECLRLVVERGIAVKLDLTPLTKLRLLKTLDLDIDASITVDLTPIGQHRGLVVRTRPSVILRGQQEFADNLSISTTTSFPPWV